MNNSEMGEFIGSWSYRGLRHRVSPQRRNSFEGGVWLKSGMVVGQLTLCDVSFSLV